MEQEKAGRSTQTVNFIRISSDMTDVKVADDDEDDEAAVQHIQTQLENNPLFATHVLLVTMDKSTSPDHKALFSHLANKEMICNTTDWKGNSLQVQLTWECLKDKCHIYWCSSQILSDYAIAACTKDILQRISIAMDSRLHFLVTTPCKRVDKGMFTCISPI
jgi:hypothetical protein